MLDTIYWLMVHRLETYLIFDFFVNENFFPTDEICSISHTFALAFSLLCFFIFHVSGLKHSNELKILIKKKRKIHIIPIFHSFLLDALRNMLEDELDKRAADEKEVTLKEYLENQETVSTLNLFSSTM